MAVENSGGAEVSAGMGAGMDVDVGMGTGVGSMGVLLRASANFSVC